MSSITLLAFTAATLVYLGFAGVWGVLLRDRDHRWAAALYFLMILLPSSLALPLQLEAQVSVLALGVIVVVLFSRQPSHLPVWLWQGPFACVYYGVVMCAVTLWAIFSYSPGALLLASLSVCAALIVLFRAFTYGRGNLT